MNFNPLKQLLVLLPLCSYSELPIYKFSAPEYEKWISRGDQLCSIKDLSMSQSEPKESVLNSELQVFEDLVQNMGSDNPNRFWVLMDAKDSWKMRLCSGAQPQSKPVSAPWKGGAEAIANNTPAPTPISTQTLSAAAQTEAPKQWRYSSWLSFTAETEESTKSKAISELQNQIKTECASETKMFVAQLGAKDSMSISKATQCSSNLQLSGIEFESGPKGLRAKIDQAALEKTSQELAQVMAAKIQGAFQLAKNGDWDPLVQACQEVSKLFNKSPLAVPYNGPTQKGEWPHAASWCGDYFIRQLNGSIQAKTSAPQVDPDIADGNTYRYTLSASAFGTPLKRGFVAFNPQNHQYVDLVDGNAELSYNGLVEGPIKKIELAIIPKSMMADSLEPLKTFNPIPVQLDFSKLIKGQLNAEATQSGFTRFKLEIKTLYPKSYRWTFSNGSTSTEAEPLVLGSKDSIRATLILNNDSSYIFRYGQLPEKAAETQSLAAALVQSPAPAIPAAHQNLIDFLQKVDNYADFERLIVKLISKGKVQTNNQWTNEPGWYYAAFSDDKTLMIINPDKIDLLSGQNARELKHLKPMIAHSIYFKVIQ